jgi:hypothetical protein
VRKRDRSLWLLLAAGEEAVLFQPDHSPGAIRSEALHRRALCLMNHWSDYLLMLHVVFDDSDGAAGMKTQNRRTTWTRFLWLKPRRARSWLFACNYPCS